MVSGNALGELASRIPAETDWGGPTGFSLARKRSDSPQMMATTVWIEDSTETRTTS